MREQPLGEIRFATLARAAEGLTQWRPLLLCFLTLQVTGALIAGAAWMLLKAGFFMYMILMLAAVIALLAGSSGVGIMLMDKAKNEPVRSFSAAASAGLLCLPKFLLVGLAVFVATLAYYLMAAVIYFICKIPVLGGILAFVVHPILVLVAAALLIAMIWVVGPLMGPALWSGLSVKAALANVLSIARKRLVEVVLMEVVLYFILGLVCFMLVIGLVPATVSLTGMAMGITGDAGSMAGMFMGGGYGGGFNPMGMMGGGSTGLIAGLGVLYCVVGALLAQVAIMGMNLIYLQARESVDPSEAEGALDSLIGDVRKKAEEAKAQTMAAAERTMAAAERAKQAASERLQEATAKPSATDTPPATDSNASAAAASAAAASAAAALTAATAASTEQAFAEQQARERAAADAADKARQSAEEAAARQRSEAEAARLSAEAEAARLKAEAEAKAKAKAAEHAARERAARERAAAEAQELAAHQRAQAQAAEEARQQAEAQRLKAQAEQQAAEREAARVRAEAEAAEKARQTQAAPSCPACSAPVAANDLFCGECGNKLK